MANKTLLQAKSYIRAKLGELDSQKVETGILEADINFAQIKTQNDLMSLLGMKYFTKEALVSANIMDASFVLPTDILSTPDALIKVMGSSTTIFASATSTTETEHAKITLTSKLPGILGNGMICALLDETSQYPKGTIRWAYTTNIDFNVHIGTDTTANILVGWLNADPLFSKYFTASLAQALGTGIVGDETLILANGAGTPFYDSREMTIEEYATISNNTYLAPSATAPQFVRKGDVLGVSKLDFLPTTINYAKLYYKYRVAPLTTDASLLTIPEEFEELVLHKAMQMTYATLKANEESKAKQVEYANLVKEYENSYITSLQARAGEKTRMQSNDANS